MTAPSSTVFETTPDDIARLRLSRLTAARARSALTAALSTYRSTLETIYRRFDTPSGNRADEVTPLLLNIQAACSIQQPDWLVENVLPSSALAFLYGREGTGKSFTALALAFSVATGTPFLNLSTRQAPVLYLTAEGVFGLGDRVRGFLASQPPSSTASNATLYIVPDALPLHTDLGQNQLYLALRSILPDVPGLIIVDTFHAYTAGADENSAREMGAFLAFANRVRYLTACTFLLVHHSKKAVTEGNSYRGHSCLAGAANTMILCRKQDTLLTLTCEKQKDAAPFHPITAILEPVPLPSGGTTCIVRPTAQTATLTKNQQHAVDVLVTASTPLSYARWWSATGLANNSFNDARKRLLEYGLVVLDPASKTYSTKKATPVLVGSASVVANNNGPVAIPGAANSLPLSPPFLRGERGRECGGGRSVENEESNCAT